MKWKRAKTARMFGLHLVPVQINSRAHYVESFHFDLPPVSSSKGFACHVSITTLMHIWINECEHFCEHLLSYNTQNNILFLLRICSVQSGISVYMREALAVHQ